jgi:ribosomal-protein-alanine N-acetyltransferase
MNYKLVPMDKGHLKAVAALEQVCFDQPWSAALLERELYNDLVSFVVAQGEDGAVLGYGEIQAVLDEGCLEKIAVAPEYRRQGVAQAILSAFLRFGRERLAFLTLEVRESNAPAIALYEKLGFQVVGRRKNYYTQPREDAVLMTVEFHGTQAAE